MANLGLASFATGFGTGYMNQQQRMAEQARQAKLDQITFDRADREKAAYEKELKFDSAMEAASAEVKPQGLGGAFQSAQGGMLGYKDPAQAAAAANEQKIIADMAATPDANGQVMQANPNAGAMQSGAMAGNKMFMGVQGALDAQKYAGEQNDPTAVRTRQLGVMNSLGRYKDAVKFEGDLQTLASGKQNLEKGALDLKTAKLADIDNEFKRQLNTAAAGGWDGLTKFISDSKGDGMNGAFKVAHEVSADGTMVNVFRLGTDGTKTPSRSYPNTDAGLAQAAGDLDKTMTPQQRIEHIYKAEDHKSKTTLQGAQARKADAEANKDDITASYAPAEFALKTRKTDAEIKNDNARTGIAGGHLALASQQFKNQTLDGKIGEIEQAMGKKLNPAERESFAKSLVGIGAKGQNADKLADQLTEQYQKDNVGATPEKIAVFRAQTQKYLASAGQEIANTDIAFNDLRKSVNNPEEYARKYALATSIGMKPEQLAAAGFIAPKAQVNKASGAAVAPQNENQLAIQKLNSDWQALSRVGGQNPQTQAIYLQKMQELTKNNRSPLQGLGAVFEGQDKNLAARDAAIRNFGK